MDTLVIKKDGLPRIVAGLHELFPVSISLYWPGENKQELSIDVTKHDGDRLHKWKTLGLGVQSSIAFSTSKGSVSDCPLESMTNSEIIEDVKRKPRMLPGSVTPEPLRAIGDLYCRISKKDIFYIRITNVSVFSANFVWLGDSNKGCIASIGSDALSEVRFPEVGFHDEVSFQFTNSLISK